MPAILGVIEAFLVVGLVITFGLLLALLDTRGVTRWDGPAEQVPSWLARRLTGPLPSGPVEFPNTGLTPVVVANGGPDAPWAHRQLARLMGFWVARIPMLQGNNSALLVLLAKGLGLTLLLALVLSARRRSVVTAVAAAASSLRRQLHRQMYRLGVSSLPNQGVGPVFDLFTSEVNDVRDALASELSRSARVPVELALLLVLMFVLSWPLSLFLIAMIGLVLLASRPLLRSSRTEADAATRDAAVQLCLLQEDLSLVRTVRVFGMEGKDKDRFDAHLERFESAEVRRLRSEGWAQPTWLLLVGLAAVLGLGLIGLAIFGTGRHALSLPAALTIAAALVGVAALFRRVVAARGLLRRANRSAATLFEYLDRRPDLTMIPEARFLSPLREAITFEDVTIVGPRGRALIEGVSASLPRGSRTAIVGLDEPAKLGLACLVPRLLDPSRGRVRIDGVDLREVTLESLRAQVATLFQADLVFSDTVLANIGLGDPSYGLPRIIEAAKLAHAHQFIQDLPNGYETVIGPLGEFLTGDQMFRIGLARAFLHDPSIVIIEESNVPLDAEVKPLIDDSIDRLARNRTLIFLPHRLSTIRRCDQVLVLHEGRLVDAGPPRELHTRSRVFRHLKYLEFNPYAAGGEVEEFGPTPV
jgi:ABC-type multidrug transport system fused ATPase/permease subunit